MPVRKFLYAAVFFFLLLFCLAFASGELHATSPAGIAKNAPAEIKKPNSFLLSMASDEVKIGTYLLNIRKLEVASGTWVVDFYVWFIWENAKINPINFEIMNGAVEFKDEPVFDTIEVEGRTFKWVAHRIVATITNDLNFKYYPLDIQKLTIEIEDRELSLGKMKYIINPEENAIDDLVKIQGWEIKEKFCNVATHKYKTSFGYDDGTDTGLTYSRYVFGLNISRPRFSSMLKLLLPLSIILSLSFLSFTLSPDKISQRISLGISTVFTSVAFHINLTSAIPQVSYLTLADRLMISCYFILFCSLISTIYLIRYVDSDQLEKAVKINRYLGILVPLFGVSLIIAQFFTF
ncbi:MAG TPA: hypothetical protein PKL57_12940 [Candidatus Wallbacteria bacterium]|nr:hypothetical protein [Candidatus Wallbacteria bacterium]